MFESTVCLFMNFGDKRTHKYWVKERTVHTALWLNGTGTTGESFGTETGADPFSSLWGNKSVLRHSSSLTERRHAEREELKGKRSVTDGHFGQLQQNWCLPRIHFLICFVLFGPFLFQFCATSFLLRSHRIVLPVDQTFSWLSVKNCKRKGYKFVRWVLFSKA